MCPKIIRIPTSVESWFLQPFSHQMLGFKPHFEKKGPDANPKIRFFIFRQLFFHFLKIFFNKKVGSCILESLVERHFAYSTTIFSYSTGECSYSTGIRARAPDPNPSETPAVTSKVIQTCPKATKTHQYWTQDSTEFQHLRKIGFCDTFHTKCLFLEPQTSRFRP